MRWRRVYVWAETLLRRKRLSERGAGVHARFNCRGRARIAYTDGDRVDALHGEECLPNIFGHHVDKADRTPTGGHVDGHRRMTLVHVEGLDKPSWSTGSSSSGSRTRCNRSRMIAR